jgi:hypothetical protein
MLPLLLLLYYYRNMPFWFSMSTSKGQRLLQNKILDYSSSLTLRSKVYLFRQIQVFQSTCEALNVMYMSSGEPVTLVDRIDSRAVNTLEVTRL